jgi:two-component system, NarL family, sensor histidine kinase UhpB
VERRAGHLVAIIEDDGVGFDPELASATTTHIGLPGMRERAAIAGGELTIESQPGSGTTIRVKLPLH